MDFAYSELLEMSSGGKPIFFAAINGDSEKRIMTKKLLNSS